MVKTKSQTKRGVSLIEVLIYCAIVIILAGGLLTVIFNVPNPLNRISPSLNLTRSAQVVMERISYEVRRSESIDEANSLFATSTGKLTLKARDQGNNLVSTTFAASSTARLVQISEPNTSPAPLSPDGIIVESLFFSKITTANSAGVRVALTLADMRQSSTTVSYYSTVILRNSY